MKLMGWKGGGIGKDQQGRLDPVEVISRGTDTFRGIETFRKIDTFREKNFNKFFF